MDGSPGKFGSTQTRVNLEPWTRTLLANSGTQSNLGRNGAYGHHVSRRSVFSYSTEMDKADTRSSKDTLTLISLVTSCVTTAQTGR
jgi:hypothetical protein